MTLSYTWRSAARAGKVRVASGPGGRGGNPDGGVTRRQRVPVHRHRGQHLEVGDRTRPHGAGGGAARRDPARRHRGPPRTGDQEHRRRRLRDVRRRRGRGAGGRLVPARAGRSGSHGRHGDPRALRPARGSRRRARRRLLRHHDQPHRADHGRRPRRPGAAVRGGRRPHPRPTAGRAVAARARCRPAEGPRRAGAGLAARPPAGCAHEFPPLRSLEALPNNLPLQLTSFVGRERELAEAKELLGKTRLLTLLGMGGLGKTRLSLQIGADLLDEYPDGVWFLDLAPITDPSLVPQRGGAGPRRARGTGQAAAADAHRAPQVAQAARHRRQLRAPDGRLRQLRQHGAARRARRAHHRHQPRGAARARRADLPGISAAGARPRRDGGDPVAIGRRAALRRACAGAEAILRADRKGRAGDRRAGGEARGHPPGAGARGRADARTVAARTSTSGCRTALRCSPAAAAC